MKLFSEHLQTVIASGEGKVNKPSLYRFIQAIYAGFFIGLAFVFYVTVTTGNSEAHWGAVHLMGGAVFSLGLILVVLFGMELFTSTVLSAVACAQGRVSFAKMLSCWIEVYIGNAVGALILVGLVCAGGLYMTDGGQWGLNVVGIALHKVHHTWGQAFVLGMMCNIMVCLAVWFAYMSKDVGTKALLMVMPVALFVATGFEHSIANMFMLPVGIAFKYLLPTDLLLSHGYTEQVLEALSISHIVTANLIPVTLGNIVGGAGVIGLGIWGTEKASGAQDAKVVENDKSAARSTPKTAA
ncbi:formate transporter FocA [Shewanella dokdonensis]|uniref:Formate transporter FocA n=1 Tax=Shewanella dokdonensis TaxID=712036 RepID=A0ABX8DFF1_9GAMM|nr:formate transporter FocA [Shewanella dokdonensis]MCL1075015.1 formate transporter FocA [Shewanella dokdonensis]QVK23439.1 formate transporter FocA [Shewanella dokdonensis]